MYTKEQVENIVKRIIHQDSFGDVHREAHKVASEEKMNFQWSESDDEKWQAIKNQIIDECGYDDDDLSNEDIEGDVNRQTDKEFKSTFHYLNR